MCKNREKYLHRWNSAKLNAGPNGADLVRKPQWFALDLLMFLKDDIASRSPTLANSTQGNDDDPPQQLDYVGPPQKVTKRHNATEKNKLARLHLFP